MQDLYRDIALSGTAAQGLISAHDGDMALLALYLLSTGDTDPEAAASALCRTRAEVEAAGEKLRRAGLLAVPVMQDTGRKPVPPADREAPPTGDPAAVPARPASKVPLPERPQYTAEDIVSRARSNPEFQAILDEARNLIGRNLGPMELQMLFGIYDFIELPAEVIFLLMNYVAQNYDERYGNSRKPTIRAFEREAVIWQQADVQTMDQAEEYIRNARERTQWKSRIQARLGLSGRQLSPTEERYVQSWRDMGFPEEVVAVAYDRTVTNTGALKWAYLDKILHSWAEKKLFTVQAVTEESRRKTPAADARADTGGNIDLAHLQNILDHI